MLAEALSGFSLGIGEFYALLCALLWAIAVVLFKASGESMSANSLNLVKNTVGVLLLAPTALLVEGVSLPALDSTGWAVVIATGIFGIAIADSLYLQALRQMGAGRTAIVASLYSPFVVILSILLLGETLAWWKWSGLVIVLTGILIVVYQRHYQHVDQQHLRSGIALAICSVFLTALGVVAMKPVLANEGFFWIITLRLLAGTLGLIAYMAIRAQLVPALDNLFREPHAWGWILTASVFGTYLAMIFWLGGYKYANASVASVLNETANVFIVLLAWLFLREPLGKRRALGVLVTFTGVLVFIWA